MTLSNHPLYNLMTGNVPQRAQMPGWAHQMQFQNPVQMMNCVMQAMQNPAAFVRQQLKIPDQIPNDPNQILQYMQSNMGVTQQDIQWASSQIPQFPYMPGQYR